MPSFAGLGKFFGRTASEGAAFAAGVAVAPALSPVVREIVNEANAKYQTHPLSPGDAAGIVAENVADLPWGEAEASFSGVSPGRFDRLYKEALNAPGVAELLVMWRRGTISDGDFVHGLRKSKLEARWDSGLEELKTERLDPATTTLAIQRRVMNDPGFLIDPPPISGSNVPPMPVSPLSATDELAAQGYNAERAAVETRLRGIPPAPGELLSMLNRGVINEPAFNLGVVEGDTRQEWAPFLIKLRRRLLSPTEYAELDLRGWISHEERDAGAALSGMEPGDADMLWKLHGRPLNIHQITTGLARGGKYNPVPGELADPYQAAVRLGSLRPEYYDLDIANKYTLPSAFVMRQLTQSGVWDEAKAAERLKWAGWIPEDANEAAAAWAKGSGAKASKEETAPQLRTEHDGWYSDDAKLLADLEALGYDATVAARVATLTDAARVKGYVDKFVEKVYKAFLGKAITETQTRGYLTDVKLGSQAIDNLILLWAFTIDLEEQVPPVT